MKPAAPAVFSGATGAFRLRGAWTLIEVLVTLALTGLVVSAALALYGLAVRYDHGRLRRLNAPEAVDAALRQVAADLTCAMACEADDARCAFRLQAEDGVDRSFALSFCRSSPAPGLRDAQWARTVRVDYRLRKGPSSEGLLLERLERDLSGAEAWPPPVTQQLARAVRSWRIEVFDGARWTEAWPTDGGAGLPKAARLILNVDAPDGPFERARDVWIPAGTILEPETAPES